MADYRAINRNFKAVEQRKKLANTFSTPASKFTPAGRPGMVSTPTPVFGDTFAKVMLGPDKKYFVVEIVLSKLLEPIYVLLLSSSLKLKTVLYPLKFSSPANLL